ncbi:hypothetical protein LMH87_010255 [Akanthomyces muscarius]|uniref:Uncharacterized protein n=1 Tax=Akanthomyces muscarius TaxID=2231603 RepID=A0A9W8QDM0_AKAMU|nr:hypothetical protein LMH87_010255 [Akanthomyces muscarius]KAJ4153782.1 hypothetical protein LMH87_010255 [Akanthomyces muscarius]
MEDTNLERTGSLVCTSKAGGECQCSMQADDSTTSIEEYNLASFPPMSGRCRRRSFCPGAPPLAKPGCCAKNEAVDGRSQ